MALATRCPHCQTTFRVAHDQLKLRAGLVRCGACKEIFNGVEHLLRPEEMQEVIASSKPKPSPLQPEKAAFSPQASQPSALPQTSSDEAPSSPSIEEPSISAPWSETLDAPGKSPFAEDDSVEPDLPPEQNTLSGEDTPLSSTEEVSRDLHINDPLQRMTLMDFTGFHGNSSGDEQAESDDKEHPETGDELSQVIDDLHNKPWRREKPGKKSRSSKAGSNKPGKAEPNFMTHARRQKRYGKAMRITMGAGSAILLVALLLQGVFAFRHLIAAKLPHYRPVLTNLCDQVGCRVELPAQIDKVSIESSELQSLPSAPSKFTLVALLRNQASTNQAWPHLELTLNDMNEKAVARKVFRPNDYLASSQAALAGFPTQSEQQIKISFEMLQLKASGYRLYLFYP